MLKLSQITFILSLTLIMSLALTLEINNESTNGARELPSDQATRKVYQPSLIRTQLKVSRSLDPQNTETLNVKSNLGGYATIIVKKRTNNQRDYSSDGIQSNNQNRPESIEQSTSKIFTRLNLMDDEEQSRIKTEHGRWSPVSASSIRFDEPTNQKSRDVIKSFLKHIENIERSNNGNSDSIKNDRKPVHISLAQPKIYDQFIKLPSPAVVRSDIVYVKDAPGMKAKRARSLMQVGTDGIPVIEGIRMPDDEEDKKKVWRNARVIKGELVPYENGYMPPKVQIDKANLGFGEVIFIRDSPDRTRRARQSDNINNRSFGPFSKQDNFNEVHDNLEDIKSLGPFTIDDNRGKREFNPANTIGGPYFIKDNSRTANSRLIDYIKQINDHNSKRDYFVGRSANEKYLAEPQQIQRRMLNNIKDFSDEQTNDVSETLRKPVSYYAHPDLGIQPARPPPISKNKITQDTTKKIQYYVKDPIKKQIKNNFYDSALNSQEYFRPPNYDTYEYPKPSTYPYNYGYLKKVKQQPLWMKFTEQVRDTFQTGITSVEAMARPVFQPIVEAGQKISNNLGLTQNTQTAQNKIGFVGPTSTIIAAPALLPALGLMAGGAALGMAVGRLFEGNILKKSEIIDSNAEHKKNANDFFNNRGMYVFVQEQQTKNKNNHLNENLNQNNNIDIVDVVVPETVNEEGNHKIYKRSIRYNENVGDLLQDIEEDLTLKPISIEERIRKTNWKNPSCAKKMFCQIMLEQNSDENVLMEKKMESLLSTLSNSLRSKMSNHLTEISIAIQKRDCSSFFCRN